MTATALTWHATAPGALRRLTATAGPAGVVLGRQHSGEVAPIRLFRAEPTRAVLVGGSWSAWLVAFRCLGAGAEVEITTVTPARWSTVGSLAGAADRVRVVSAPGSSGAASTRPLLRLDDVGLGEGEDITVHPWQTMLTVVPTLTPTIAALLADANVVLLQRLSPADAEAATTALRLPPDVESKLCQLHDDMLVVVVAGVARFLWFATTPIEEELLGPPRRSDAQV